MKKLLTMMMVAAALPSAKAEVVLGRLGRTLVSARIFSQPTSRSQVYYRVRAYESLILQPGPNAKWRKVVMEKGQFGFIPADSVAVLPYELIQRSGSATPRGSASVGRASLNLSSRSSVLSRAIERIGKTRYVWGGTNVYSGADCSGFVKQMFGGIGVQLPRTAAEQALVGLPITRKENLRAGDRLYFWEAKRNKIGHTGIYLGDGYFVHSSRGRGGVGVDALDEKWQRLLVAARR